MKTKVFIKNKDNKIEFTEKQLKELLDEIYNEGYNDGKYNNYIYTTPYKTSPWWSYTTTIGDATTNITTGDNLKIHLPTDYTTVTGNVSSYKYQVPKEK